MLSLDIIWPSWARTAWNDYVSHSCMYIQTMLHNSWRCSGIDPLGNLWLGLELGLGLIVLYGYDMTHVCLYVELS